MAKVTVLLKRKGNKPALVQEKTAKVLVHAGLASYESEAKPKRTYKRKSKYETRVMTAEKEAVMAPEPVEVEAEQPVYDYDVADESAADEKAD